MYEMKITFGKDKQTAMTREEITGIGELLSTAILTIKRGSIHYLLVLPTGWFTSFPFFSSRYRW